MAGATPKKQECPDSASDLNPLARILRNPNLQRLKLSKQSDPTASYKCHECGDSGLMPLVLIENGKEYDAVRNCKCKVERIRTGRIGMIPKHFQSMSLDALRPNLRKHRKQAEILDYLRNNPLKSYVFSGKVGVGKSTFAWALCHHAIDGQVPRFVACSLVELLQEYRTWFAASTKDQQAPWPRVIPNQLRQNETKYFIMLDDIDKARPTEYASELLFDLTDAIYAYGHQVVVTTNLPLLKLIKHFEKADPQYGASIVRRLTDPAKIFEMF